MSFSNTRLYKQKHQRINREINEKLDRIDRATKYVGKLSLNASPAQEIEVLERYVDGLRTLAKDLKIDYGIEELSDASWRVEIEITKAVAQITDIKINALKPE